MLYSDDAKSHWNYSFLLIGKQDWVDEAMGDVEHICRDEKDKELQLVLYLLCKTETFKLYSCEVQLSY